MTNKERLHLLLDLFDTRPLSAEETAELKQLLSQPELRRSLVNRSRLEATIIERTQHWAAEERAATNFIIPQPSWWKRWAQSLRDHFTPRTAGWATACLTVVLVMTLIWHQQHPVARLANVSGKVSVQRGEDQLPGFNGLPLMQGDVIQTDEESAATVKWLQEPTTVKLHSSAELQLVNIHDGKRLVLRSGLVSATVAKQISGHPLLLTTPNARAEVLGTRFRLKAEPDQTRLDVNSGRVQLSRGDDGTGIIVERLQTAVVPLAGEVQVQSLPTQETLHEDLLAHWEMDMAMDQRSIQDITDHSHVLRLKKGANVAPDRGGSVLFFSKKDAAAQCTGLTLPSTFTVSFWLKIDGASPNVGIEPLIANSRAGIGQLGFRLFLSKRKETGQRSLYFETGNGHVGVQARSSTLPLKPDCWHHLAITVDRESGCCALFCDGLDHTSISGIRSDFALDQTILLGQMPTTYHHKLNGSLDDMRIYGRLLSPSEIQALASP